jgi:phosphotriesterase-related protein
MSTVHTIRGPIDSADLGRTLSHEHLTGGAADMQRIQPPIYDEDEAVRRAVGALRRAKEAGVDSIIDLTPRDLGRQATLFQRVAEADTGVHVVCATGVYRWVPFYLFRRNIDEVAAIFLHEIEHGIDGTGIRAGIIKLAWDYEYRLTAEGPAGEGMPRAGLERTARAAARAAKAGGVPISCHTLAADELGTPLMDLFEDEGLDPAMVTIGHSNDSQNIEYVKSIGARGFNIGLDRFSATRPPEEIERRSQIALDLAKAGYAAQTSLGHDGSPYYRFTSNVPDNPEVWTAVNSVEVPWLLSHGATQADVDAMQITSIRRTFEAAARVRGSKSSN